MTSTLPLDKMQAAFGDRLQENVRLAPFTSARVGGPADAMLIAHTAEQLAEAVSQLWFWQIPFVVLGGGSNVLVSDAGVKEVVILNRARGVRFNIVGDPPTVWAESGANFGTLARRAVPWELSGLEWAAGIPGTIGGAVVGNAGAHGGDMAGNLIMAEILHLKQGREMWPVERLAYGYRTSALKGHTGEVVVLAATLRLVPSTREAVQAEMDRYLQHRRSTQPAGASMGSMFKNPPGDYAGRLIEEAGLKGQRRGAAQISPLHANFFINHGGSRASEIFELLKAAQEAVFEKFGIELELEIELIGDWSAYELG